MLTAQAPKGRPELKCLLLMRHAKSDWDADYEGDHERPLNDRGIRSARLMGRLLAARASAPDLVVSSTAVRARSTAHLAAKSGSWGSDIELDSLLYDSGPTGVISRAAQAPDVERLMLVGHQPTWSILVGQLSGQMAEMKTASVAVLRFDIGSWSDLPGSRGELTALHHPRSYFGSEWDLG